MPLIFDKAIGEDFNLGVGTTTVTSPSGGTLPGTQISLSTLALNGAGTQAASTTWAPGAISASQSVTTTLTVTGASLGDFTLPSFSLDLGGATLNSYISSANTVTFILSNPTATTITITSGTVKVLVFKVR